MQNAINMVYFSKHRDKMFGINTTCPPFTNPIPKSIFATRSKAIWANYQLVEDFNLKLVEEISLNLDIFFISREYSYIFILWLFCFENLKIIDIAIDT